MKGKSAVAGLCVAFGAVSAAHGQALPATSHATGTFAVKLTPQPPEGKAEGVSVGRTAIDKTFHGDLKICSLGGTCQMGHPTRDPGEN